MDSLSEDLQTTKIALKREAEQFAEVAKSKDMREGVRAFLEKRQPKFQDE